MIDDMRFRVEELNEVDWFVNGDYKKSKDSSIMFSAFCGGYEVFLGDENHLSLDVDYETGRCYSFYTLWDAIKGHIINANIYIPPCRKAKLYFDFDKSANSSGCHYLPFVPKGYWDKENKILCFGDKDSIGEIIEFSTGTFVKIKENKLLAIYVQLTFMYN